MVKLLRLVGAVALLLLLVTCGTAANLSIARLQSRERELRTRLAIGAGRGRLLRLLLLEHTILAGAAAAAGGLLAFWIPAFFSAYTLPGAVRLSDLPVGFDAAQAAFAGALLLLLATALTVFTIPTWWRRGMLLAERDRATRPLVIRRTLVAAQVAMSLALLFCGGLLFKSLRSQIDLDAAFRNERVLMANLSLPRGEGASSPIDASVFRSIRERLMGTDGVVSASWSFIVPYGARRMQTTLIPRDASDLQPPPGLDANIVDVGYFRTVNVPIVRGRAFTDADRDSAEPVVIVTEALAARYWPGREPLGQRLAGRTGVVWTIVGVVPDNLHYDIRALRGGRREHVFFPLAQSYRAFLPVLELDDAARQHQRRSPRACRPGTDDARRAGAAGGGCHHDGSPSGGRRAVAGMARGLDGRRDGRSRAGARRDRAVRNRPVYRRAAHPRDRDPPCARRGSPRRRPACAGRHGTDAGAGCRPGAGPCLAVRPSIGPLLHGVRPFDLTVLTLSLALTAGCAFVAVWLPARAAARIEPADALRLE